MQRELKWIMLTALVLLLSLIVYSIGYGEVKENPDGSFTLSAEDLRLYDQAVIDLLFFKEQAIVDALLIEGLYKTVEKQDEIIVKSEKKLKLYRVVTIVCVSALTFTLLLRLLDD